MTARYGSWLLTVVTDVLPSLGRQQCLMSHVILHVSDCRELA